MKSKMTLKKSMQGLAIFAAVLALPLEAHATLLLAANVGGANICASDNNVGCGFAGSTTLADTNAAVGVLSLANFTLDGITINGSLAMSTRGNPDTLSSSSLTIFNSNSTAVTITFAIGDTGYNSANVAHSSGSGTFLLSEGSTLTQSWFNDANNAQGGENPTDTPGVLVDTLTTTAVGPAFSFSQNGGPFPVSDPGAYSMTNFFTLNLVGGGSLVSLGQTLIKTEVAVVPEPDTLALLGIGLLGFVAVRRVSGGAKVA